jgi:hypothetical protein
MPEIRERPPSMLRNIDGGPLGGAAEDPGAPTINTKNVDGSPQAPMGGGGGGLRCPRSKRCIINLHGYKRQEVILLTGPTFPAPGPAMAYDP